jgi:hypothetical protein
MPTHGRSPPHRAKLGVSERWRAGIPAEPNHASTRAGRGDTQVIPMPRFDDGCASTRTPIRGAVPSRVPRGPRRRVEHQPQQDPPAVDRRGLLCPAKRTFVSRSAVDPDAWTPHPCRHCGRPRLSTRPGRWTSSSRQRPIATNQDRVDQRRALPRVPRRPRRTIGHRRRAPLMNPTGIARQVATPGRRAALGHRPRTDNVSDGRLGLAKARPYR